LRQSTLQSKIASRRRRTSATAGLCLFCSLLLGLTAASGLAASPPAPLRAAGTHDAASGLERKPDAERLAGSKIDTSSLPVQQGDDSAESLLGESHQVASWSSVRTRGLESPVDLKPEPGLKVEPADALDGTPKVKATSQKQKSSAKKKEPPISAREQRVWPLPDGSFVFTQAFGCVPQLGNLYFPGAGCPADRPVIHTGIDLAAPEGTVFYAAASGWVTLAGYDRPTPDANTRIIIQHDGRQEGYSTEYLHWVASYVAVGDYVRAGDPIGEVGNVGFSTGPHLHFSVIDLSTGEHIDPVRWLPLDNNSGAYKGRLPGAEMRLPAGTTAGQPEEADQSPPPPPKKEKVPKSPPADERGGAGTKRHHHKRDAPTNEQAGGDSSKQGRNKRAVANDGTATDTSNSDQTKTRERHKDGKHSDRSASGDERTRNHKDKSADSGDALPDTGGGGHRNKDSSDSGNGSRHDRGGSGRGGSKHDQGGSNDNGSGHDRNNERGNDDGKNNGSSKRDGGQSKNGDVRKKEGVSAESATEPTPESGASVSQGLTDEASKDAVDEAAPQTGPARRIQETDKAATSADESSPSGKKNNAS
jgi:murein DD-endopeptidase MepM/ murein hydrolase activator NlpD